jgi:hypothetical protein
MGRPPKPIAAHRLRGLPSKTKIRHEEPAPGPALATPPEGLSPGPALRLWETLAPELIALGVLTSVDREEFALGCRLRAQGLHLLRVAEAAQTDTHDTTWTLQTALGTLKQSSSIFARFGIGAADRTRVHLKPTPVVSKWDGLIGGREKPA